MRLVTFSRASSASVAARGSRIVGSTSRYVPTTRIRLPASSPLRSEFFREAALADARLTDEQDETSVAGDGRLEASAQFRELRLATDEDSLRLVGRLG